MKAFFRNLKRCVQRLTAREETFAWVVVALAIGTLAVSAIVYAVDDEKFEKCEGDVQCELNVALFEGLFKIN